MTLVFVRSLVPEAKLRGRYLFDNLPNDTDEAIRHLDVFCRSSVYTKTNPGRTDPRIHDLAHVGFEVKAGGAVSLHRVGGEQFYVPRYRVAVGIIHIQIKIPVWILPNETREGTPQIHALTSVELHAVSVMRKRGNRRSENKHCHENTTKFHSQGDISCNNGFEPLASQTPRRIHASIGESHFGCQLPSEGETRWGHQLWLVPGELRLANQRVGSREKADKPFGDSSYNQAPLR